MGLGQKEIVEEIRGQWRQLWHHKMDDKERAEGIASEDYGKLFVEKGMIVHATRNFKALNFKEILEQNKVENAERFIQPSPQVGGWTKFIKMNLCVSRPQQHRRALLYLKPEKKRQQPKNGGRGWLHK